MVWVLRITVVIQCLGNASELHRFDSSVFSFLWNNPEAGGLDFSEQTAAAVETVAEWVLIAGAISALVRPLWIVLLPVALWEIAMAASQTWMGGSFLYQLALPAHAARIAAPIVLAMVYRRAAQPALRGAGVVGAMWIARLGIAFTFIAHGCEAWYQHPRFVDLLLSGSDQLLDWQMPEDKARTLLMAIAVVDWIVAGLIVVRRWPAVAYYMAFWGAVTAVSRVVQAGMPAYAEALLRASHAGLPLAIGLYWQFIRRLDDSSSNSSAEASSDDAVHAQNNSPSTS